MKKRFLFVYSEQVDGLMYWLCFAFLGLMLLWHLLNVYSPDLTERVAGPCMVYAVLHFYCPGCGGTRAVRALWQGEFLKSFCYHPFVLYATLLSVYYLGCRFLGRAFCGKCVKVHFYRLYFLIAIALYVLNFVIKNVMLLVYDIDILNRI